MSSDPKEQSERRPARVDFVTEVVDFDDESGVATFSMRPDPRRYTTTEKNGETLYVDKYLKVAIPLTAFVDSFEPGIPSFSLSPSIGSTNDYAHSRLNALEQELEEQEYVPPKEKAIAHQTLLTDGNQRELGFISVDICGASALRKQNASRFDQSYSVFLRELGTLVGQFNGSILKTKGDGFIAFIDHPSFTSLCDGLIDLGLSLLQVLHDSINPALSNAALPRFDVRIGADYGEAIVSNVTVPTTGFSSVEVYSDALNRAVKIEESCAPNEYRIGRDLYELIHVQWLERAEEIEFDGGSVGMPGYQTYLVK